jgi:hypothetical protein
MSQPVKLSDALVLDARLTSEAAERSIAGQVEFWARLGRSVELLLEGRQVLALRRNAGAQALSKALASVDTPAGRKRVADVLASQPYPHFKQYSGQPGLLVRTDEDGKQTVGRFVNRAFVAAGNEKSQAGQPVRGAARRTAKKRSSAQTGAKANPVRAKATTTRQPREREAWA